MKVHILQNTIKSLFFQFSKFNVSVQNAVRKIAFSDQFASIRNASSCRATLTTIVRRISAVDHFLSIKSWKRSTKGAPWSEIRAIWVWGGWWTRLKVGIVWTILIATTSSASDRIKLNMKKVFQFLQTLKDKHREIISNNFCFQSKKCQNLHSNE